MKIALVGATGFVGSAILNEALDRGRRRNTKSPRELKSKGNGGRRAKVRFMRGRGRGTGSV